MSSSANHSDRSSMLSKQFMLQEAIQDIGLAVSQGLLCNSCELASPAADKQPSASAVQPRLTYISAADRLKTYAQGVAQIRKLFDEFTQLNKKSAAASEEAIAKRADACRSMFLSECNVDVDPLDATGKLQKASSSPKSGRSVEQSIAPLQKLIKDIQALATLPRYNYEKELKEAEGKKSSAAQHFHLIVKRLVEVLESTVDVLRFSAENGTDTEHVAQEVGAWPSNLVKLLQGILKTKPLSELTESTKEQIRRISFDVEELQHEQQVAVTDGDMQKSEQLYFEQTSVLETLKPQFEQLENILQRYRKDKGESVRESLKMYQNNLRQLITNAVAKEERNRKKHGGVAQNILERRSVVEKTRKEQKNNMMLYVYEWDKMFKTNEEQQTACWKAMAELEKRMQQLAAEQTIMVRDRLERVNLERERELNAQAFYHFCDKRCQSVLNYDQSSKSAVGVLKEVGEALEYTVNQADFFIKDCILQTVDKELKQLRLEQLEQFRQLYLTLGDLEFKKSRHAEEIDKKVEYYAYQQEVAMDALNPKAKEYSQAKKKWEAVQEEIHKQVRALQERTEAEALAFKPTEQLLIEAGIEFSNPVDELRSRNQVRQQKLIEYKELMEAKVAEQHKKEAKGNEVSGSISSGFLPFREDDEVILAEKSGNKRNNSRSSRALLRSQEFGGEK